MNIIRYYIIISYSPWSAPVWLVPKKQDKNLKKRVEISGGIQKTK